MFNLAAVAKSPSARNRLSAVRTAFLLRSCVGIQFYKTVLGYCLLVLDAQFRVGVPTVRHWHNDALKVMAALHGLLCQEAFLPPFGPISNLAGKTYWWDAKA